MEANIAAENAPEDNVTQPKAGAMEGLSKRQMKKRARLESRAEKKLEERAHKKADRAAKKAKVHAELAKLPPEELEARHEKAKARALERREEKAAQSARVRDGFEHGIKLVIDLDFPGLMLEKEVKSLVQQLTYCVSCNQKAATPCSLQLTSFTGEIKAATAKQFPGHVNWVAGLHEAAFDAVFAAEAAAGRVVYLTADADAVLDDLRADHVYVIGGLVDRNRHKGICLERAQRLGVKTASLPLKAHLALSGSRVLTVNHVVGMLVKFVETKDWKAACEHVVPVRKQVAVDDDAPTQDKGTAAGAGDGGDGAHKGTETQATASAVPATGVAAAVLDTVQPDASAAD